MNTNTAQFCIISHLCFEAMLHLHVHIFYIFSDVVTIAIVNVSCAVLGIVLGIGGSVIAKRCRTQQERWVFYCGHVSACNKNFITT